MNKEKLLNAFIENPSNYTIDVSDNSMLPDKLKGKDELKFTVKPPVLSVLAKCALVLNKIPKEILEPNKEVKLVDAIKYVNEMAQVFSILSWGKTSDYPSWYVPFIVNNVTPKELFQLFEEVAYKTQSSFFLNSTQIAGVANPMMMS